MSLHTPPDQPKRSWFARHKIWTGIGVFLALVVVISVARGGGGDSDEDSKADAATAAPKDNAVKDGEGKGEPAAEPAKSKSKPKPDSQSAAEEFRAFVAAHGSPTEKAAAQHVTKVQGADEQNDILDSAEIHTDYTGGLVGPDAPNGKLLATAFADWKDSKNGLVTVYDANGEILANGNY